MRLQDVVREWIMGHGPGLVCGYYNLEKRGPYGYYFFVVSWLALRRITGRISADA